MSANKFYIPKEFFVKNVQKIFPKEAKCQLARDGYFICQCDEDYKTKFGSFVFENEKGTKFYVNVTDYMTFQSSVSGSECDVHSICLTEDFGRVKNVELATQCVLDEFNKYLKIQNAPFTADHVSWA
jgi:hypothetical protein